MCLFYRFITLHKNNSLLRATSVWFEKYRVVFFNFCWFYFFPFMVTKNWTSTSSIFREFNSYVVAPTLWRLIYGSYDFTVFIAYAIYSFIYTMLKYMYFIIPTIQMHVIMFLQYCLEYATYSKSTNFMIWSFIKHPRWPRLILSSISDSKERALNFVIFLFFEKMRR